MRVALGGIPLLPFFAVAEASGDGDGAGSADAHVANAEFEACDDATATEAEGEVIALVEDGSIGEFADVFEGGALDLL